MTLSLDVHPDAADELAAAVAWYAERAEGLGGRLRLGVKAKIESLLEWPDSAPLYPDWADRPLLRQASIPGFPYRVIYFVEDGTLKVVAVAHERREPGYWAGRLPG